LLGQVLLILDCSTDADYANCTEEALTYRNPVQSLPRRIPASQLAPEVVSRNASISGGAASRLSLSIPELVGSGLGPADLECLPPIVADVLLHTTPRGAHSGHCKQLSTAVQHGAPQPLQHPVCSKLQCPIGLPLKYWRGSSLKFAAPAQRRRGC
jgi:hypothetical protein